MDRAQGRRSLDGRPVRECRRSADHRPGRRRHGGQLQLHPSERRLLSIRGPTGQYYATSWANIGDPAANQGRTELVRYESLRPGTASSTRRRSARPATTGVTCCATPTSSMACAWPLASATSGPRTALTNATLDPTVTPEFIGPMPDVSGFWRRLVRDAHPHRVVRSGPLDVQGYFNSPGSRCQQLLGFGWRRDQKRRHAVADPGRNLRETGFGIGNTALYGAWGVVTDWGAEDKGRNFGEYQYSTKPRHPPHWHSHPARA